MIVAAFTREPQEGGDSGVYHNFVMQQLRRGGEGGNSCYLYNDSGALTLSKGFFGISDGTVRGSVEVTTAGTISIVGLTASRWAKVEASVSGTAVTFEITSIAAASSPVTLPTDFTNGYDQSKQGFYITGTKRCIGVVWITGAGALGPIINSVIGKKYRDAIDTGITGEYRRMPVDNTDRTINIGAAMPAVGAWSAAIACAGSNGIPSNAKMVRMRLDYTITSTAGGSESANAAFGNNNTDTPSALSNHPQIYIIADAAAAADIYGASIEIDIPLNASGQFYVYLIAKGNVTTFGCLGVAVGYYVNNYEV